MQLRKRARNADAVVDLSQLPDEADDSAAPPRTVVKFGVEEFAPLARYDDELEYEESSRRGSSVPLYRVRRGVMGRAVDVGMNRDVHCRDGIGRWFLSKAEAADFARVMFLTQCDPAVFERYEVAQRLIPQVEQRLKREHLPAAGIGLGPATLQGPYGAVRESADGALRYAGRERRIAVDDGALTRYIDSLGEDKQSVADYASFCRTSPEDEITAVRWSRVSDLFDAIEVKADALREARFDVLEADLALREAVLAQNLRFAGAKLPYEPEPHGHLSWLGSKDFIGRDVLAAWRRTAKGSAGRGTYLNKRKTNIREALYEGMLF